MSQYLHLQNFSYMSNCVTLNLLFKIFVILSCFQSFIYPFSSPFAIDFLCWKLKDYNAFRSPATTTIDDGTFATRYRIFRCTYMQLSILKYLKI